MYIQFSSVQSISHIWLFVTPWTAAPQASLSITSSRSSLKLIPIELVMPLNHLILCRPLLLLPSIFPSIRVFSNESALSIRWPKDWSFSFNISPSNEHLGLISFRIDWLDLLVVQGTLKSLLQQPQSKSINSLALSFIIYSFISIILFYFFTLQYCIGFTIHQHESVTGVHKFPLLNPNDQQPLGLQWLGLLTHAITNSPACCNKDQRSRVPQLKPSVTK